MKKTKIWSVLMLIAMALPITVACGDDDNDGNVQKESEVEIFCRSAMIDINKYELQKVNFNHQPTSKNGYYGFAGYEKGSDRFHFWMCKFGTEAGRNYFYDIKECYNDIVPRNRFDMGFPLDVKMDAPLMVKEFDITKDYGDFLQLFFSYTDGEKNFFNRKLIFVPRYDYKPSITLMEFSCSSIFENDYYFFIYDWYNNLVAALSNLSEDTVIFGGSGDPIYIPENIEEFMKKYTFIEQCDYNKCIAFRKIDNGSQVEIVLKIFGIDTKSLTTSLDLKSIAKITSEIISSDFSSCIFRLICTGDSGERKYLKYRVDKIVWKIELIEN